MTGIEPMNFALRDEQRMLVQTVRAFIAGQLPPLEEEVKRTGVLWPDAARAIHGKAKAHGRYAVGRIAFWREHARRRGEEVTCDSERALFRLDRDGFGLAEIAPGADVKSGVRARMTFPPRVSAPLALKPEACLS